MQDVQLRDFLNFSFLSALTLSPDGKNAGFVVSRCDEARDGYQCDFWRLDLTTGKTHQVSRSGNVRSFLWLDDDTVLLKGERSSSLLSPSTSFLKLLRGKKSILLYYKYDFLSTTKQRIAA